MPTINHVLLDYRTAREDVEIIAEVAVNPVPAYGDGWNEPREPAHAETWVDSITIVATDRLTKATRRAQVEVPKWLADAICEAVEDEANALAVEELQDADAAYEDEKYEFGRAAE